MQHFCIDFAHWCLPQKSGKLNINTQLVGTQSIQTEHLNSGNTI